MAVPRGAVLLLFLLLVAAEMGTIDAKMGVGKQLKEKEEAEEKEGDIEEKKVGPRCTSESLQFKGLCLDNDKCAETCLKENFTSGKCKPKMAVPTCFCKKPC